MLRALTVRKKYHKKLRNIYELLPLLFWCEISSKVPTWTTKTKQVHKIWEFWEDIMKKAIHKFELNVFLADKILEVLNIHSKGAKKTTNLIWRIHEELSTTFFHMKLVSKFAPFAPQMGFVMIVSAPQVYKKRSAVRIL